MEAKKRIVSDTNDKEFLDEYMRRPVDVALRDVIKSRQQLEMVVEENYWNLVSNSVTEEHEAETDENIVTSTEDENTT